MEYRITAIVPAAGIGKRFGSGTNKPFEKLHGKPLLVWALGTLDSVPEIREIIPVIKESEMGNAVELFERYPLAKVRRIAPGGRERQQSVFHGLKLVDDRTGLILVHDGVRPFVDMRWIYRALTEISDCDGVVTGVPVKDTIKIVEEGMVKTTLRREHLWAVQTPQLFRHGILYTAHEKAVEESFNGTDDASLVEHYGGTIKVIAGSYGNIKITTPEDLIIAEVLAERGILQQ